MIDRDILFLRKLLFLLAAKCFRKQNESQLKSRQTKLLDMEDVLVFSYPTPYKSIETIKLTLNLVKKQDANILNEAIPNLKNMLFVSFSLRF